MDRESAFNSLEQSPPLLPSERLRNARYLARNATDADWIRIIRIREAEYDFWVQKALDKAIAKAEVRQPKDMTTEEEEKKESLSYEQFYEDVYTQATEDCYGMFLHELRPIVGSLEAYAKTEVNCYRCSKTRDSIKRILSYLDAIDMLRDASTALTIRDFDLTDLVSQVSEVEARRNLVVSGILPEEETDSRILDDHIKQLFESTGIEIILARREPVHCSGAPKLIELALGNAIRNAIEAVLAVQGENHCEIVLNWGVTDVDSWVVVLDEGGGLPEGSDLLMKPGVSTKPKGQYNLGMGLAIAQRAIRSAKGTIKLTPRSNVGTSCEIRWPHKENIE